jgi:hypothetical protein
MAERSQPKLAFARRTNTDGTIDSICRTCFATIATAFWETQLDRAEREHVCDPVLLERYHTPPLGRPYLLR